MGNFIQSLMGGNMGGNNQGMTGLATGNDKLMTGLAGNDLQSLLASIGIGGGQSPADMGISESKSNAAGNKQSSISDFLNGQPQDIGKNLDTLSSSGKPDFTALLQSLTPKEYKQKPLLDQSKDELWATLGKFGENLSSGSKNNKEKWGIGALLGDALGATNKQQREEFASGQKGMQDIIKDVTGTAVKSGGLQNDAIKNANTDRYQSGELAETIRSHNMNNSINQQKVNSENYTPLGMDAEGNTILFDKKTGKTINAGKVTPSKGNPSTASSSKKPAPISVKEANDGWKEIQKAVGGNLDESSKARLLEEYASALQENGKNAPAALEALLKKYDVKGGKPGRGFKNNGFLLDDNYVLDESARPKKTIVKQQRSPSGQMRIVYSDGTEEIQ